ncbi:MAG TPA: hypothetical protein VGE26_10105 [Sphingobacteriaceae bacterium]
MAKKEFLLTLFLSRESTYLVFNSYLTRSSVAGASAPATSKFSIMKKPYLVLFFLIAGIAIYSLVTSYNGEEKPVTPATMSPEGLNQLSNPSAQGINPEHGMPGHRCDIMVGAPLPGAGSGTPAAATPAAAAIPQAIPATPGPATTKTNPEHGLPGHRCDLKVGDPLP